MTDHRNTVDIEGLKRRAVVLERERREENGQAATARFTALNMRNRAARLEQLAQSLEKIPKAATALGDLLEERHLLGPELERLADLLEEYARGELVDRRLVRIWHELAEFARGLADRMQLDEKAPKPAKRYAALVEDTATILEDSAAKMGPPPSVDEEGRGDE